MVNTPVHHSFLAVIISITTIEIFSAAKLHLILFFPDINYCPVKNNKSQYRAFIRYLA